MSNSLVGAPVTYRVADENRTTTRRGDKRDETGKPVLDEHGKPVPHVVEGSIHHPEIDEFAGQVVRSYDDDTHDLAIHAPNRAQAITVSRVKCGDGANSFTVHAHASLAVKGAKH
jgi:hypothetical protein